MDSADAQLGDEQQDDVPQPVDQVLMVYLLWGVYASWVNLRDAMHKRGMVRAYWAVGRRAATVQSCTRSLSLVYSYLDLYYNMGAAPTRPPSQQGLRMQRV